MKELVNFLYYLWRYMRSLGPSLEFNIKSLHLERQYSQNHKIGYLNNVINQGRDVFIRKIAAWYILINSGIWWWIKVSQLNMNWCWWYYCWCQRQAIEITFVNLSKYRTVEGTREHSHIMWQPTYQVTCRIVWDKRRLKKCRTFHAQKRLRMHGV